jgi:hypothetical protein
MKGDNMHEPNTGLRTNDRQRRRQLLDRVHAAMAAHARAAMAEARGKLNRAATILSQRIKADSALNDQIDLLQELTSHLRWPVPAPPIDGRPSLAPPTTPGLEPVDQKPAKPL